MSKNKNSFFEDMITITTEFKNTCDNIADNFTKATSIADEINMYKNIQIEPIKLQGPTFLEEIIDNTKKIAYNQEDLINKFEKIYLSLNHLSNSFENHAHVEEVLLVNNAENLKDMLELLKNPNDKKLISKFEEMPFSICLQILIQAINKYLGLT